MADETQEVVAAESGLFLEREDVQPKTGNKGKEGRAGSAPFRELHRTADELRRREGIVLQNILAMILAALFLSLVFRRFAHSPWHWLPRKETMTHG